MCEQTRLRTCIGLFVSIVIALSLASPVVAVIWRLLYRSVYYVGWGALGAADGLFRLETMEFPEIVKEVFWQSRHYYYWCVTDSALLSLGPGLLSLLHPFELWPHFFTLACFAVSVWLIGLALDAKRVHWACIMLAIGCSPALLTFSISYPYISAVLPHALMFWIVASRRIRRSWLLTLLLGLMTAELSFHVYEIGRTCFVILLVSAAFDRRVSWQTRACWILVSLLLFTEILGIQGLARKNMAAMALGPTVLWRGIRATFHAVLISAQLDLPFLPLIGLALVPFLKRHRAVLFFGLLAQWFLIVLLARGGGLDGLRPRRFLLLEFYNLLIIGAFIRDKLPATGQRCLTRIPACLLLVVLAAGNIAQYQNLYKFTSVPVTSRSRSLPYINSKEDFFISPGQIEWVGSIATLVKQGKKLLLIYSCRTGTENSTDPLALPERLYLRLGHDLFKTSVVIFDSKKKRFSRVPIRDMQEVDAFLEGIPGDDLSDWIVVQYDDAKMRNRSRPLLARVREKYTLTDCQSFSPNWSCSSLSLPEKK